MQVVRKVETDVMEVLKVTGTEVKRDGATAEITVKEPENDAFGLKKEFDDKLRGNQSMLQNEDTEDVTNTVLMKDASTEKETNSPILRKICVAVIILVLFTVLFGLLSSRYQQPWTALYVIFLTTAYHFIMRLIVGEVAEKLCSEYKFKTDSFGFRIRTREAKIYKTIRVKAWKKYAITAKPEKFDLRSNSLEGVLHSMMQAELAHRIIMLLSFVPLLLIIPFGAPLVFLGTSIVACLIDMKYVIIQRYNRIRVQRIICKKSTSV